jgi:plastocyanin
MRKVHRAVYGVLVFGIASFGCGNGSDGNPNTPSNPPGQPPVSISIVGDRGAQSFNPNPASVSQNGTVTWRNADSMVHRIVFNDNSGDTGDIAPGATSRAVTLSTNGTNYHCTIHPTMIGAISSSNEGPPPCTGIYC